MGRFYIADHLYKAVLPLLTQALNYIWQWPKFTRRDLP